MSWCNNTVLEFVELYRREQHLWDPKHPLHRNRCEINDSWLKIQSSLSINCSVADLKKKKESLMTSFRMHLSKKKAIEGYRTTWFAYPLMESFLGGKYECDSTNQMENDFYNISTYSQGIEEPNNINKIVNNSEKNNSTPRQNKSQSQKSSQNTKLNFSEMHYPKRRSDEAVSYLNNTSDIKSEMDEYDLYGQLLAKKLRKLDEHQRDLAMHEIDNVMFRAKMQTSSSQSRSYGSSPSSPQIPRKLKSPIFIVAQQNTTNVQYEDENIPYPEQHPS